MRRFMHVGGLVIATVALATAVFASSAGAGVEAFPNSLTILKNVVGEVPEGTSFTVRVACTNSIINDGGPVASQDVHFDSTGQPTDADTIEFFTTLGTCTVTEPDDGNATTTTYKCEGVATAAPVGSAVSPICPEAGPQGDSITVNKSFLGIEATVTVENVLVALTETPTTTPAPKPAAAPAVVAQANFTG